MAAWPAEEPVDPPCQLRRTLDRRPPCLTWVAIPRMWASAGKTAFILDDSGASDMFGGRASRPVSDRGRLVGLSQFVVSG